MVKPQVNCRGRFILIRLCNSNMSTKQNASPPSYENLPRVEVSFQDDFSGSSRELYQTPIYIVRMLQNQGINPSIGQKLLLYEKDTNDDNTEYYLCNIGEIVEAKAETLKEYESYGHIVSHKDLTYLEN